MTGPVPWWMTAMVAALLLVPPGPPQTWTPAATHAPAGAARRGPGVWPLTPAPAVVRRFEAPSVAWGPGHRGVDLLGRPGQAVRAPFPGRISFVGTVAGRGVVVIDHDGSRTSLEPVDPVVHVGEVVVAGTTIGALELPRSHCYPRACLHWGLRVGGEYRDPLVLLGLLDVRLLPLTAVG